MSTRVDPGTTGFYFFSDFIDCTLQRAADVGGRARAIMRPLRNWTWSNEAIIQSGIDVKRYHSIQKCFWTRKTAIAPSRNIESVKRCSRRTSPADAVFYILKGKVKLTVVSEQGKEAVVAIIGPDEFFGEGCLTGQQKRLSAAVAVTDCEIARIEKAAMLRVLHEEPAFSAFFIQHLLDAHASGRSGPCRSIVQFQREAFGTNTSAVGTFRQGRCVWAYYGKDQPGDACGDGWHDTPAYKSSS